MKDLDTYTPTDPLDTSIRQALKNWAASRRLPAKGKARLLLVASSPNFYQTRASQEVDEKQLKRVKLLEAILERRSREAAISPWLWGQHPSVMSIWQLI
jgi:glutathione S-transferase